jgi:hypothetical protein
LKGGSESETVWTKVGDERGERERERKRVVGEGTVKGRSK